jgi:hypothetical protein
MSSSPWATWNPPGLREWVDRHRPRYLLHGHTTPDSRTQTHCLGVTEVTWVRGVALLELERT